MCHAQLTILSCTCVLLVEMVHLRYFVHDISLHVQSLISPIAGGQRYDCGRGRHWGAHHQTCILGPGRHTSFTPRPPLEIQHTIP